MGRRGVTVEIVTFIALAIVMFAAALHAAWPTIRRARQPKPKPPEPTSRQVLSDEDVEMIDRMWTDEDEPHLHWRGGWRI